MEYVYLNQLKWDGWRVRIRVMGDGCLTSMEATGTRSIINLGVLQEWDACDCIIVEEPLNG